VYHSSPKKLAFFQHFLSPPFLFFSQLTFHSQYVIASPWVPYRIKGTVSRDFYINFFHESSSPKPLKITLRSFRIFWKFASQGAPLVSTTPGGKFANGVNNTSDKIAAGSKGTVSRVFYVRCFSWIIFPQAPKITLESFRNFRKFAEIFTSQGALLVSTTLVANLPPVSTTPAELVAKFSASGVDTGGNFVPGVVDTSSNFATGVVGKFAPGNFETSGAPWLANISANFRKIWNDPSVIFRGLREDDSWKTLAVKISSVHPWYRSLRTLRAVAYNSLVHVQCFFLLSLRFFILYINFAGKGGRSKISSANRKSEKFDDFFIFFLDVRTFPKFGNLPELRYADNIFPAICGFTIYGFVIFGPNYFSGLKTSANP
jgi:hypothetical protein